MATAAYRIAILLLSTLFGTVIITTFSEAAIIYDGYNKSLDVIPSDIPLNVTIIELKRNNITYVPNDAFAPYRDLIQLGMKINPLTSISTNAFRGSTLTKIVMSDIEATEYPNIDHICGQLIVFEFNPNSQIVIPDNYTNCMTQVKNLELNGVTNSTLDEITKAKNTVVKLTITKGDLPDIPINALEGFVKLDYLRVISSGLTTFPNLTRVSGILTRLLLNWDDITEVPYAMLAMLFMLRELSFAGQNLNTIPDPLMEIESLDLKSNDLTDSLATADWLRCINLTSLTIDSNQLTYIPDLVAMGFRGITISALDNPLKCNCDLGWMIIKVSAMIERGINIKLSKYPCAAPAHLTSVPWNSMTIEQLCPVCKWTK